MNIEMVNQRAMSDLYFTTTPSLTAPPPSFFQRQEDPLSYDPCSEAHPHLSPLSSRSLFFKLIPTHRSPTQCPFLAPDFSLPLKKKSLHLLLRFPSHFTPKHSTLWLLLTIPLKLLFAEVPDYFLLFGYYLTEFAIALSLTSFLNLYPPLVAYS